MIVFDQVTKRYPSSGDILQQLSFSIDDGEMVFVTGHSGRVRRLT
jgi:cell division transport system ATP-binding protein